MQKNIQILVDPQLARYRFVSDNKAETLKCLQI
jgi:hypothetical protein